MGGPTFTPLPKCRTLIAPVLTPLITSQLCVSSNFRAPPPLMVSAYVFPAFTTSGFVSAVRAFFSSPFQRIALFWARERIDPGASKVPHYLADFFV